MPVIPGSKMVGSKRHTGLVIVPAVQGVTRQVLEMIVRDRVNITHLARVSGVCKETIYRWPKGNSPRLRDLEAIAQVLDVRLALQPTDMDTTDDR